MLRSPDNKSKSNPDLHSVTQAGTNVTQRKRKQPECELTQAMDALSSELKKAISDLREDMKNQFSNISASIINLKEEVNTLTSASCQLQCEVNELREEYSSVKKELSDLGDKYVRLTQDITELKSTANFDSDNYADCSKRIRELDLKVDSSSTLIIESLERKIDTLEQQARQCNIEIANMPEKRGENLIGILESIGSAVNMSIASRDIISIHRVPHAHAQNNRPKNIIVKFTSRILRDNLLKAYRLSKGLTTDRVGLSGTPCRFYMNEHLTLRNKELFRKCREAAKASKFKFVWVRNATVLVRESEESTAFSIRTEDDIPIKIKSKSQSKNTKNETPSDV